MPMFPIFNFLVWRQMFLQALLLPGPRSFFADARRHGKGMQSQACRKANESKYKNLAPFFSQGENGPDFLARLTLGQPSACPRAIWTLTRAKSLCLCAFFPLEMGLFLMGCFPGIFKRENGPVRSESGPLRMWNAPLRLMGCFGHPAMVNNGPLKSPLRGLWALYDARSKIRRSRITLNLKARKAVSVFWPPFALHARAFFPVVRRFFWRIPTEQALHYKNFGLYYGLASGTLPLYAKPCAKVKGGCASCDLWWPPFGALLPKTRVWERRALECKRKCFRTLSSSLPSAFAPSPKSAPKREWT